MKYLLFVLYLLLSAPIFSQNDTIHIGKKGIYIKDIEGTVVQIGRGGIHISGTEGGDSVSIQIGGHHPDRKVRTRWVLMDLGTDAFISDENYTLENGVDPFEINAWKSTNVNLHLFQQRINLIKKNVNLHWGLTFHFHKYYFENPVVLDKDVPQASFTYFDDVNFKKNRLSSSYLTMPLMLNFKSNPNKQRNTFQFSVGGYGGPRLGANFKTKVSGDKDKVKDDFNLEKWRYGIRAEIRYGYFTFYGTVPLNNLFQESKDNGFKVTPISIGMSIIPF